MNDVPAVAEVPGWRARLELGYARHGAQTLPVHRRHEGPLRVQKHFLPEPHLCEHIIVHPPGGIAGGDRLELDVALGPDAQVRLTTPGATKWYRSAGPRAEQHLVARLASGSRLEWLPQEQIVFSGADTMSTQRFELEAKARLIAWDVVALGRLAGAQPFISGAWRSQLELVYDGRLVFSDRLILPASDGLRASPLGLSGHDVLATALFLGPELSPDALAAARAVSPDTLAATTEPRLVCGLTQLPHVLVARALGSSAELTMRWLVALWHHLRPAYLGGPAIAPRIWRT